MDELRITATASSKAPSSAPLKVLGHSDAGPLARRPRVDAFLSFAIDVIGSGTDGVVCRTCECHDSRICSPRVDTEHSPTGRGGIEAEVDTGAGLMSRVPSAEADSRRPVWALNNGHVLPCQGPDTDT